MQLDINKPSHSFWMKESPLTQPGLHCIALQYKTTGLHGKKSRTWLIFWQTVKKHHSARRCSGHIIYMQVHMLDCSVRWIYSYWLSGYSWDRKLKCNVLTLLPKLYILDHLSPVPKAVHPHQLGPSPMPTKSLQPHCWTWEAVLHKCVIKCQHASTMTVLTGSGFQGLV